MRMKAILAGFVVVVAAAGAFGQQTGIPRFVQAQGAVTNGSLAVWVDSTGRRLGASTNVTESDISYVVAQWREEASTTSPTDAEIQQAATNAYAAAISTVDARGYLTAEGDTLEAVLGRGGESGQHDVTMSASDEGYQPVVSRQILFEAESGTPGIVHTNALYFEASIGLRRREHDGNVVTVLDSGDVESTLSGTAGVVPDSAAVQDAIDAIPAGGTADLEPSTNVVPVLVTFGQSNETGYNVAAMSTFAAYTAAQSRVVYTMYDDWGGAVPDVVTQALQIVNSPTNLNYWGSEMIAGTELASIYGNQRIAWVKNSFAGESLTNWLPGAFGWTRLTNAITLTTSFLAAQGYTPDVRWMSLMQGEAEAASGVYATNWATLATNIFTELRELYNPSAHVAICRLSDGSGVVSRVAYATVTQQQAVAVAALTNASLISTTGFAVSAGDGVHFSGQGIIDLGEARLRNYLVNAPDVKASRTLGAPTIAGDIEWATIGGQSIGGYVASLASGSATAFFELKMTADQAVNRGSETALSFDTEVEDASNVHVAGAFQFPVGVVHGTFNPVHTNGYTRNDTRIYRWRANSGGPYVSMQFVRYASTTNSPHLYDSIALPFTINNTAASNKWYILTYSDSADAAQRKVCGSSGTHPTRVTGYVVPR